MFYKYFNWHKCGFSVLGSDAGVFILFAEASRHCSASLKNAVTATLERNVIGGSTTSQLLSKIQCVHHYLYRAVNFLASLYHRLMVTGADVASKTQNDSANFLAFHEYCIYQTSVAAPETQEKTADNSATSNTSM